MAGGLEFFKVISKSSYKLKMAFQGFFVRFGVLLFFFLPLISQS